MCSVKSVKFKSQKRIFKMNTNTFFITNILRCSSVYPEPTLCSFKEVSASTNTTSTNFFQVNCGKKSTSKPSFFFKKCLSKLLMILQLISGNLIFSNSIKIKP